MEGSRLVNAEELGAVIGAGVVELIIIIIIKATIATIVVRWRRRVEKGEV
jgi:hypothetical protein